MILFVEWQDDAVSADNRVSQIALACHKHRADNKRWSKRQNNGKTNKGKTGRHAPKKGAAYGQRQFLSSCIGF
jgi:hypothetical protein